jgi:hypothetical protein
MGVGSAITMALQGGASTSTISSSGLLTIQPVGTRGTQIGGNLQHVPTTGAVYNITSSNIASHNDQWSVSFVPVGNAGGAGTPISGNSAVNSYLITDVVQTTGNVQGLNISHNVAPNGNSASGSRIGLGVSVVQVGTAQGGTITNPGITSGAVINAWGRSNLGGTSNLYAGALNGLNPTMEIQAGATFLLGGSGIEIDTSAEAGASYGAITQQLNVMLRTHATRGYLNENMSLLIASQGGALADLIYGVRFVDSESGNPFDPFAKLIYSSPDQNNATMAIAADMDFGNNTVSAFHERAPYVVILPLQANAITGATRLTSDGSAASSFIYETRVTARGTGYTTIPTITVTGGSGTVLHTQLALGGGMGKVGVFNPGTGVPAEAIAAVTGGGGSGATVALVMAGNTMNFPINSAVDFDARVVMRSTTGEAVCWTCEWGATMGATASTTAIIGAPTWTVVWSTAGALAAIGISNPTADTTLGAINVTVTPTSLTWSGGGQVRMTKSTRV